jgi:hypothetical protein
MDIKQAVDQAEVEWLRENGVPVYLATEGTDRA